MDAEPIRQVLSGKVQSATGVMQHADHRSFYSVVPFYAGDEGAGGPIGAVHVAEPLQPIQAHLRQFLTQRLLFLALVTGLLIVSVNLLINQTVSLPLSSLAKRMERVHQGDLETRVPVRTSDELGQIGQAFNAMIEAVRESQQAIERERSRLALLYDISRRLANAADWEEVVDLLVRIPGEVVEAVGCLFASFDEPSSSDLSTHCSRGLHWHGGAVASTADLRRRDSVCVAPRSRARLPSRNSFAFLVVRDRNTPAHCSSEGLMA